MGHHGARGARRGRRFGSAIVAAGLLVGATASAAGAAKLGNGVGTEAALDNPQCDAERGRIRFVYQGWVPCVKAWEDGADNGGATTEGVDATSIKVVVRAPTQQELNDSRSPIRDRATTQFASAEDAVRDALPIFEKGGYETWGRTIEVEVVETAGSDEASQRADAVKVAAMKPFAVIDLTEADVFASDLARQEIMVIGGQFPNKSAIEQAPYRWPIALDTAANAVLAAEFVGKNLVGKPAKFAGDDAFTKQRRVFGTVRPEGAAAPDFEPALDELADRGGKLARDLTYEPPFDTAALATEAQELAPTLIAQLKDAGVTSVLVLSEYNMVGALTKAVTAAEYFPEWILMGAGLVDVSILGRTMDQEQWAHAFGASGLWVPVRDLTAGPSDVAFQWYWGPSAGAYSQGLFASLEALFAGVHMAGPKLTAENFEAGMFSRPPTGGAAEGHVTSAGRYYGKKAGLPYDEYLTGGDVTLVWWDPETVGPSTAATFPDAKGVYQFVDGAKRYRAGEMPKSLKGFFDEDASTFAVPTTPPADVQPDYPCDGCPSSGGTA